MQIDCKVKIEKKNVKDAICHEVEESDIGEVLQYIQTPNEDVAELKL